MVPILLALLLVFIDVSGFVLDLSCFFLKCYRLCLFVLDVLICLCDGLAGFAKRLQFVDSSLMLMFVD